MQRIESDNVLVVDGENTFQDGPPGTTVNAAWLNSVQEEIANVIEGKGIQLKTKANDTQNQLWQAIQTIASGYDLIVTNQVTFNSMIERVAANQYKIKDDYSSVYMKAVTGGYACSGGSSFLSSGDTWGYIETNNCTLLKCEPTASFHFGNTQGYIEVDTDDCYMDGVTVEGTGTVAAAITQSFLLNANRVTFNSCKTHTRLSNADYVGFQGSGTDLHNITSCYDNCNVYNIDGTDKIYAYKDCHNLTNCIVDNINGTVDDIIGFGSCSRITNGVVIDIAASGAGNVTGYNDCKNISSSKAKQIDAASTGAAAGFDLCIMLSSCDVIDVDSDSGSAYGFKSCYYGSVCRVEDVDSSSSSANGFDSCKYLTSCTASSNGTDGYNDCDGLNGCNATSNTDDGFEDCNAMNTCFATANGGSNYSNTFADWGETQATADTATGGYNG